MLYLSGLTMLIHILVVKESGVSWEETGVMLLDGESEVGEADR